jgi:FkbM family methyltransferase
MAAKSRPAVQRILARRVYEPDTLAFMREHCGDGDIVHAGTFFGDFLPALSSACSPQAKVWAFEPNPDNFRCASITVAVNNLGNVSLMNAGLGAAATQQCVQTKDDAGQPLGGASRIIPQSDANDGSENVDIVAIDDIVPGDRNVSIMQLDVEGYEQEALTGGLQTIRRCRPMIVLEVPPDSDLTRSEWFSRTLLSMGYRQTAEVHYNQVFECRS